MRLIDADSFVEFIDKESQDDALEMSYVIDLINDEPTVEAIPVEYLENMLKDIRDIADRHKGKELGDMAEMNYDVILGVIDEWREKNGTSVK